MEPYSKSQQVSFFANIDCFFEQKGLVPSTFHQGTGYFELFNGSNYLNGFKNPLWKNQIAHYENAGTPASGVVYSGQSSYIHAKHMVRTKDTWGFDPGGTTEEEVRGFPNYDGLFFGTPAVDPTTVANATNRCIQKFLGDITNQQSALQAGEDVGELKQTIETLISPMSSLRKHVLGYFPKLRKLRANTKRKNLGQALSDSYLEWTFGVNPLLSDIAKAHVNLGSSSHPNFADVDGGASIPFDASGPFSWNPTGSVTPFTFSLFGTFLSRSKFSIRYKGKCVTHAVKGVIPLAQDLQLQVDNFVPTAWQLLPWSFIADYFVNIGDIITAASFRQSNLSWGIYTLREETEWIYGGMHIDTSGTYNPDRDEIIHSYCSGGDASFKRLSWSRGILLPSDLIPSVQFSLPVSSKPWLNIASILYSNHKALTPFF